MYRVSIGLLVAGIIAFAPALTLSAEISATEDSFKDAAAPVTNYGNARTLRLRRSGERVVLIKFDESQLPARFEGPVLLRLHVDEVKVPGRIEVRRIVSDWQEQSVTFNTRPRFARTVAATYEVSKADVGQTIAVDVTGLVSEWYADPSSNFGLAVSATTYSPRSAQVHFTSREQAPGPSLTVNAIEEPPGRLAASGAGAESASESH